MVCRHEGVCGGCGLQSMPYADQLALKTRALRDRLPAGTPLPVFVPVFPTEVQPWQFRQKVAFVFGPGADGRGLAMGHYARGSRRLVAVEECPVHSERGNRIAFALHERLARAGIQAADAAASGILRHLLIRTTRDDREAVAMLVVTRNDKRLRRPVRALLESADRPDGFFVNVHDAPGPFMVGPETIRIDGHRHIRERVGGWSYLVSPTAFFQTNIRAAEALQALVMDWVGVPARRQGTPPVRVLELYAGSGLFSIPLVASGAALVAVEENRQAVQDAEANLRLNRLSATHARFIAGRVEASLATLERHEWDAVVLDPPRQGCPSTVLDAVFGRLAPSVAVYVSCSPDALADELPRILSHGYRLTGVRAVDMFPHTDHIETIVRLVRA